MNRQIKAMITLEGDEEDKNSGTEQSEDEADQTKEEETQATETAQLSMHVVQGTSSKVNTFALHVYIGKVKAMALVDTGSTGTFIDSKFVVNHHLPLSTASELIVLAANGQEMLSQSQCKGCKYTIQGKTFCSDFRAISLQGMILS
jgi:hypothetical protein